MSFLEEASKVIRESGGRMTSQREIIIQLLEETTQHLDAEGLYHLAFTQDNSISLATVYRTLNALEDAGLIQPRYLSHDHERKYYEPVEEQEHYHFTCQKCHRVIEFRSELIDALKTKLETQLGIEVAHACVCFDGLCPDCRKKEQQ